MPKTTTAFMFRRRGESPRRRRTLGRRGTGGGLVGRFARDSRATSALEYGLILSMIAVVVVLAVTSLDINVDHVGAIVSKAVKAL
jgi:Flp pilus assembly pilin Flp